MNEQTQDEREATERMRRGQGRGREAAELYAAILRGHTGRRHRVKRRGSYGLGWWDVQDRMPHDLFHWFAWWRRVASFDLDGRQI